MYKQNSGIRRFQTGLSTLVVILLLLFVATLVTLYTANSSVREQQISANQLRADQALSSANAGLDYAFAFYAKSSGVADKDGTARRDLTAFFASSQNAPKSIANVTIQDSDPTVDKDGDTIPWNDNIDSPYTITSVGYSDDSSATRTIEVQVDMFGLVPSGGLPGFPLIAKGTSNSLGNISVINRFSNATIWTGAGTFAGGSAETYVFNPLDPATTRSELISITGSPDPTQVQQASYKQGGLNSDVIENDHNLKNMTNDEFFQNFMREDKATVRAFAEGIGQRYTNAVRWNDLEVSDGVRGLVWIDGDWSPSGTMQTIGSEEYPMTLIINGDFDPGGGGSPGIRVIGLVYVIGDFEAGANFAIQGGAIVEGDVTGNGNPTIVYDENLYDGSLGNPPGSIAAIVAGTWKDW